MMSNTVSIPDCNAVAQHHRVIVEIHSFSSCLRADEMQLNLLKTSLNFRFAVIPKNRIVCQTTTLTNSMINLNIHDELTLNDSLAMLQYRNVDDDNNMVPAMTNIVLDL